MKCFEWEDVLDIIDASSYEALAKVALRVLRRLPPPVAMICGPITSGGTSPKENRDRLKTVVFSFQGSKDAVFNQMPFLKQAEKIRNGTARRKRRGSALSHALSLLFPLWKKKEIAVDREHFRKEFHLPLLKSRLIREIYFLPGWEGSVGSRWYHTRARELGIKIKYLSEGYVKDHAHAR